MIWEAAHVESHQRLIQREFEDAKRLFEEKNRRARLIENDAHRNTAGHKARNQYLESLLSLQLRAKKHFCFRELKLLTQTVDQLQLERRREVNVKKNPNPDIILDAGWKSARPPERGVEIKDTDLVEATTEADDWYMPKPQPSKRVRQAREAAEARRLRDAAEAASRAMENAANISSGAVRRVGDKYAWFNKMPDSYSGTYRQFSDKAADLLQRGDLEEAMEMAEKCVRMEPENPEGYRRKGSVLRAMNRFEDACAAFKKAGHLVETAKELAKIKGKVPLPLEHKIGRGTAVPCMGKVKCFGRPATKFCYSCGEYNGGVPVAYCDACFAEKHPWFRENHVFDDITHRQLNNDMWDKEYGVTMLQRELVDLHEFQEKTRTLRQTVTRANAAGTVETSSAVASLSRMETNIVQAVTSLRAGNIRELEKLIPGEQKWFFMGPSTAALEELQEIAVRRMQSCVRMYSAHKKLRLAMEARFEKHFDPDQGSFYYVDKELRKTMWHRPALLGSRDLENSPQVKRQLDAHRNKVASKLQALFRSRKAWAEVVKPLLLRNSIRKYWDPRSKSYYYASTRTGWVSASAPLGLKEEDIELGMATAEHLSAPKAALMIQTCWRRYTARSFALRRLGATWVKAWDPLMKRFFYFDHATNTSQWNKPALFRDKDAPVEGDDPVARAQAKADAAVEKMKHAAADNVHEAAHAAALAENASDRAQESTEREPNEGDMITEDIEMHSANKTPSAPGSMGAAEREEYEAFIEQYLKDEEQELAKEGGKLRSDEDKLSKQLLQAMESARQNKDATGLEDSITAMLAAGLAADAESILAAKKLVDSLRNGSGSPSNRAQLQREARKAAIAAAKADEEARKARAESTSKRAAAMETQRVALSAAVDSAREARTAEALFVLQTAIAKALGTAPPQPPEQSVRSDIKAVDASKEDTAFSYDAAQAKVQADAHDVGGPSDGQNKPADTSDSIGRREGCASSTDESHGSRLNSDPNKGANVETENVASAVTRTDTTSTALDDTKESNGKVVRKDTQKSGDSVSSSGSRNNDVDVQLLENDPVVVKAATLERILREELADKAEDARLQAEFNAREAARLAEEEEYRQQIVAGLETLGKEAKAQQDEASLLAALQTHISMQWLTEEHPAVIQARSIANEIVEVKAEAARQAAEARAAKAAAEKQAREEKLAAAKAEAERLAKELAEEEARLVAEEAARVKAAEEEAARKAAEAAAAAEAARIKAAEEEAVRVAEEKAAAEKAAAEKAAAEKAAAEKAAADKAAADEAERKRLAEEEADRVRKEAEERELAALESARRTEEIERRKIQEAQRVAEKAEQDRLEAEKKAEEERLAAEKKAEEERIAAAKKAEAERVAAQKKAEEERLAAEKKAEEERIAAEKRAEDERIAAEQRAAAEAAAEASRKALEEKRLAAEAKAAELARAEAEAAAAEAKFIFDAAARLQSWFRHWRARQSVRALVRQVFHKIWDDNSMNFYYYNSHTGESQWTKPKLLRHDDDIALTPRSAELSAAARRIQSLYRARAARYYLKWLAKSVIEKIFDPSTGATYYFNTYTGTSSWTKPALLGDEDVELTPRSKAKALKFERAAIKIQNRYRARLARWYLRLVVQATWEKAYDPDSQMVYYFNKKTQESSWEKPALVGIDELELTPRSKALHDQQVAAAAAGQQQ